MNDVLTLVGRVYADDGYTIAEETRRDVFCRLASIGQSEFYQAAAAALHPELKFILADYMEHEGEQLCIFAGEWYRVIRTYRAGQTLELTVQRAPAEEVGVNG